ncbi:hypothetical protein [Caballeronia sp. LZ001]|nr:hypothetical protein [Caballeronia sp. LZ001]MDR5801657.1 hypothetical protein [Caballeronia sp. LZ001]
MYSPMEFRGIRRDRIALFVFGFLGLFIGFFPTLSFVRGRRA